MLFGTRLWDHSLKSNLHIRIRPLLKARTGVIDFVEEKKLVEQIIMTNWNPLACEPVKSKTYLAELTCLRVYINFKWPPVANGLS
jgi:hypothetical protein